MTGFGRAEHTAQHLIARVELSSVNRKQGEVVTQIPRTYSELEPAIKKHLLSQLTRGRIQALIHIEPTSQSVSSTRIDLAKAKALSLALDEISQHIGQTCQLSATDLLRAEGVIHFEENQYSAQEVWEAILPALEQATTHLISMRAAEGNDLKEDLLQRIQTLKTLVSHIEAQSAGLVEYQKQNLLRRLSDTGLELNPSDDRVLKEIAIFAERCDISEEITRLNAHLKRFVDMCEHTDPIGRSLDFLCQEVNREFNTIGSKSHSSEIAFDVVSGKTELEKIREQVQNIE